MLNERLKTLFPLVDPGRPAIVLEPSGQSVSFAELEAQSNKYAHALRKLLAVGEVVAIALENRWEFLVLTWAAQRAGLRYTTVNRHLTAEEVAYIVNDSGATVIVTSPHLAESIVGLDDALDDGVRRLLIEGAHPGWASLEELSADEPNLPIADEREGLEFLYSSGTTGKPKGIRRELPPVGSMPATQEQQLEEFRLAGMSSDSVYLSPAPLYHAAPLVACMASLRVGATVVVLESFDPQVTLRSIATHGVTHAQFVPTMFLRMLKLPEAERLSYDVSSLQWIVHAAAPCPVAVKQAMLDWWGPIIHEYYAGSEGIGGTVITPEEWLAHPGSVGRPFTPAHIIDEDGEELPVNEVGTVYFEGGLDFEYHGRSDDDRRPDGWRTYGDMGYLDTDGYLYLTDRATFMIVSGGVNIYPQEIEDVLIGHDAVVDVAVFGVPDPDMGEQVKAVVQLRPDVEPSDEVRAMLSTYCRQHLAGYKCPKSIDFTAQLPRSDTGKLYKRKLREEYWVGHQTRIGS